MAVECRPALEVNDDRDHPDARTPAEPAIEQNHAVVLPQAQRRWARLFYLAPPCHPQACDVPGYRYSVSRDQHRELDEALVHLKGMVVLSGDDHPDYREWFGDWPTLTRETTASTAAAAGSRNCQRTDVLWSNPQAWERRAATQDARTA